MPILLLAIITLAAGAAAAYYYLKVRSVELELENALKKCSNSIEMMHGYYIELAERTVQKEVISREEADEMMQGIKEIVNSTNLIKAEKGKQ